MTLVFQTPPGCSPLFMNKHSLKKRFTKGRSFGILKSTTKGKGSPFPLKMKEQTLRCKFCSFFVGVRT